MKRLYRSEHEKILCGVCGGLAEYFNVDPTIVRLAVALLFILNPAATLILYLIACIIMPKESEIKAKESSETTPSPTPTTPPRPVELSSRDIEAVLLLIVGVVLVLIGLSLLSSTMFTVDILEAFIASLGFIAFIVRVTIGALLLALGIIIIVKTLKKYENK